jgi:hypothetical protein
MNNDNKALEEEIINSINSKESISAENIRKADIIGYKNQPDKVVLTDQFGFIKEIKQYTCVTLVRKLMRRSLN